MKENKNCLNCELYSANIVKGHCKKCYRFYIKIIKLNKGEDIYNVLGKNKYTEKEQQIMFNECIRQIKCRLQDIRDANILRKTVTAHELEYQINSTIRSFGKKGFNGRYGLGKINDYLEYNTNDNQQKQFIFQLFAKIKLLNKFKLDFWKILEIKIKF